MDTYCDACGVKKTEEGKHPDQQCEARQWAAHQGRMMREIIIALNRTAKTLDDWRTLDAPLRRT
jgi:hypothetical protein